MKNKTAIVLQPDTLRERVMNLIARIFAPHVQRIFERRMTALTEALVEAVTLLEQSRDVMRMDTAKKSVFDDRQLNARRRKAAARVESEITKLLDKIMRAFSKENHEATH